MKANFRAMEQSTQQDWNIIVTEQMAHIAKLPDRIIQHLHLLENDYGGFPVDRLQHCLQTAHLAADAGEDDEYVVCALLHDIGDTLGSTNHADVSAAILHPFISAENHWMVKHHAIFQGYNFFHYLGMDRNLRDQFKDSAHYQRTARFVEKYDNPAFDASAPTLSVSLFEPQLREVFKQVKRSLYQAVVDKNSTGSGDGSC